MQARNATCQAILSLTLAARALGTPFARGCDGETISIMAERDGDDWQSEWEGERAERADGASPGRVSSFGGRGGARRNSPRFYLTAVSWRSPHVSQRWRGCESKWSHAMSQALETHPARVSDIQDADVVFLDVETAQERNWPRMRAGAGTANMRRWRGCLPGATNDTYGWFPDKWPPRDHGYLWLLEKFAAQGFTKPREAGGVRHARFSEAVGRRACCCCGGGPRGRV